MQIVAEDLILVIRKNICLLAKASPLLQIYSKFEVGKASSPASCPENSGEDITSGESVTAMMGPGSNDIREAKDVTRMSFGFSGAAVRNTCIPNEDSSLFSS